MDPAVLHIVCWLAELSKSKMYQQNAPVLLEPSIPSPSGDKTVISVPVVASTT